MWLFSVSALYALIHFKVASNPKVGVYAQHWDLAIFDTYIRYWGLPWRPASTRPDSTGYPNRFGR